MRHRSLWLIGLLVLGTAGGVVTLSLSSGQTPMPPRPTTPAIDPAIRPASATNSGADTAVRPATHDAPATPKTTHDLDKMPPFTRQVHLSAWRGAEWLHRVDNPVTGRFLPGWVPALNVPIEGDHFLHQAEAAFALARAARYFGDERYLMKARQATLSLMAETRTDPADPNCRCTTQPGLVVNRLAAAGMLLMLIHELPDPANDLLQQGEELAAFIRKQQRAEGSLRGDDDRADPADAGPALYGLMLSLRSRPAAWKLDVARRALPYYRAAWKSHQDPAFVPWQCAACCEAYARTREAGFAEFAFELADWTCSLQYTPADAQHPGWVGGFKGVGDSKAAFAAPELAGAALAEGLAEACRLTRQVPDATRNEKYRFALASCAQFLMSLQFTEDNTRHFAQQYRPLVTGGFHTSAQDGNLQLEHHPHAVSALVQFLAHTADR
jgi:hypothetical protein